MKKKWIASQIKDLLTSFPAENSRMKKKCFIALAACALALLAAGCNNGFNDAVLAAMQNNAKQEPVAVESVEIEPETITLAPGTTRTLTATVLPNNATDKTVTWFSSNTSVATVGDDGTVTAASLGEATIYAQAGDKMAECWVNVRLPDVEGFVISDYGTLTGYTGNDADVTIPDGVTSIGNYAFEGCTSLASVTIPASVTRIGNYAFEGCTSLASVEIPASVTSIGYGAFEGCDKLTDVTYGGTLAQWQAIEGSSRVNITYIQCSDGYLGVKDAPDYLTMSGTVVTGYTDALPANLVIPDGVTGIRAGAFKDCTTLTTVTIPTSVTEIASYEWPATTSAFSGCTNLDTVTYQGTLAQWCALGGNDKLMYYAKHVTMSDGTDLKTITNLVIPNDVTSIGSYAFQNCTNLESVTIPASVKTIRGGNSISFLSSSGAFSYCTNLASVEIPASVTSIEYGAFNGCDSLTDVTYKGTLAQWCAMSNDEYLMLYAKTVTVEGTDLKQATMLVIPDGATEIKSYAFYKCESLESVTIGNGVESIGYSAFEGCTSLASVTIPASVTRIGGRAFRECTSLESVEIPDGVTSIVSYAFYGCTSLTTVTYGGTKDKWRNNIERVYSIFYDTKVTQITDKDGVTFTVDSDGNITE